MNGLALDKRQIERQFERAAQSYNQAATLQLDIIHTLLERSRRFVDAPKQLVDLGCGTGLGLVELEKRFPEADLLGVDIAQAMLKQASTACEAAELLKADIENLPLHDHSFDLVFSTSTLQWCDLDAALAESFRILKPGGRLMLATFGPQTHAEWKAAWANTDSLAHTLQFPDQSKVAETISDTGFTKLDLWTDTETLEFDSTEAVLKSVKSLGATNANTERQRGLMGKERFKEFLSAFEKVSPSPCLTYEMIYVVARK